MTTIAALRSESLMLQAIDRRPCLVLSPAQEPPPRLVGDQIVRYHYVRHSRILLCSPEMQHESSCAHLDPILQTHGYVRLFENFYFRLGGSEAKKTGLLKSFFEWLARRYESRVTKDRNCACYDHLIELALRATNIARPDVLDFGCGSGGVLASVVPNVVGRLTGYDFSGAMSTAAKAKGLEVLSPLAFAKLGKETVDVVMSVYVLHYGMTKRQLNHLLLAIRPGGAFVANFHKELGVSDMMHHVQGLPSARYETHWSSSEFGRCICIAKHHLQPVS